MKYIEPSPPGAIRPRNSAPASKLHISMPALCADAAGVLSACGAPLALGVGAIAVAASGLGHGAGVHVPTSW